MRRAVILFLLVSIQAWVLAGCGESNPLIGEWRDVSDVAIQIEEEGGLVVVVQFTETSLIMGDPGIATHIGVEYTVHDDYVTVSTGGGKEIRVELEDADHISMDTPYGRTYLERL
jgi:hypothetical protein